MKKIILTLAIFILAGSSAWALTFNFSGTSENGVGSATMEILISGNTLTAALGNTSPTTTTTNENNIPGITGFGFNLTNDPLPGLTSWSFAARDSNDDEVFLDASGTGEWVLDTEYKLEGKTFDIFPNNDNDGVNALLYNPLTGLPDTEGSNTIYFTTAILQIVFAEAPGFAYEEGISPYIRMQRVGDGAEGSLKLFGIPGDDNGGGGGLEVVPEPGTFILFGAGLLGLGLWGARRKS